MDDEHDDERFVRSVETITLADAAAAAAAAAEAAADTTGVIRGCCI